MRKQYENYDSKLLQNDYLKRHYECLPFIGEQYESSRLLLIGESHYVPKAGVQFVDREDFYDISFDDLPDGEYKGWIHTRSVFEWRVYHGGDLNVFFRNPAAEIAKIMHHTDRVSNDCIREAMHQYAFMNYFKRPSYKKGRTIERLTEQDYQCAYDTSCHIIDVLQPTHMIFLSKKAFYAFCDSDQEGKIRSNYSIKSVSHPSSHWWNRRRKDGGCAREDFYGFVSHWFLQNTFKE